MVGDSTRDACKALNPPAGSPAWPIFFATRLVASCPDRGRCGDDQDWRGSRTQGWRRMNSPDPTYT